MSVVIAIPFMVFKRLASSFGSSSYCRPMVAVVFVRLRARLAGLMNCSKSTKPWSATIDTGHSESVHHSAGRLVVSNFRFSLMHCLPMDFCIECAPCKKVTFFFADAVLAGGAGCFWIKCLDIGLIVETLNFKVLLQSLHYTRWPSSTLVRLSHALSGVRSAVVEKNSWHRLASMRQRVVSFYCTAPTNKCFFCLNIRELKVQQICRRAY